MQPLRIDPDAVPDGATTHIIGDPINDLHAVEYLVEPSQLYPGRPCLTVYLEVEEHERELIARGGRLALSFDGGELPWNLTVLEPS